ncbi:MAG: hypothetical protein JRE57_00230 [Deltaproteobacteria bacterium]|nr:hypothetical protein [Deltaproteobacteria bacterium]
MGVPIEFVFGGLSWSGSSVSLRTLENHFLMYRRLLLRFVNWAKNRLRLYLGMPDVDIGFTEFKMADDIQRKQIVIQLNAANKISDHTMLTELGFDYDDEQEMIEKEAESRNRIQAITMKAQAEAQGESQIVQAKYQARAQEAFNEAQGAISGGQPAQAEQAQGQVSGEGGAPQQPGAPPPQEGAPGQAGQQPPGQAAPQQPGAAPPPSGGAVADDSQMATQAAQGQAAEMPAQVAGQAGEQSGGGQVVEMDAARIAKQWANKISKMESAQRVAVLDDLRRRMPNMARIVEQLLGQMRPGETAAAVSDRMKPLPQKAPPRRKDGSV